MSDKQAAPTRIGEGTMKTHTITLAIYRDSKYGSDIVFSHKEDTVIGDYHRISEPVEVEFPLLDNPDQFKPDMMAEAERELAEAQARVDELHLARTQSLVKKLRGEQ